MYKGQLSPDGALLFDGNDLELYKEVHAIADPFLLEMNGGLVAFVELEGIRTNGNYFKCIAAYAADLEFKSSTFLGELELEEGYEYSFPYLFSDGEKIYLFPDATKQGEVREKKFKLFSAAKSDFPLKWNLEDTSGIGDASASSDKIIINNDNLWWLFVSDANNGGCLRVFTSENIRDWSEHSESPILRRSFISRVLNRFLPYSIYPTRPWRLAGGAFKIDGVLYLPIQHKYKLNIYGEAVSLLKINTLQTDKLDIELSSEVFMKPDYDSSWRGKGAHHVDIKCLKGKVIMITDGFDGSVWRSAIDECTELNSDRISTCNGL